MALALKFFTCLVLTVCVVASVDAEISCSTVTSTLAPCANYLSNGGAVPDSCCAAIKKVKDMAQTTPDRQQTCRCLQAAAKSINTSLASSLPEKCGVSVPYPISTSTDCDTIK